MPDLKEPSSRAASTIAAMPSYALRISSRWSAPNEFAAMCFYGAIEQLLTGWIFEVLPRGDDEYERAKDLVVEAICGGLENGATSAPGAFG